MNTHTVPNAEMNFSPKERSHLESVFGSAFEKLKQSMLSSATSEYESNNPFDKGFHESLTHGLHLIEKFV